MKTITVPKADQVSPESQAIFEQLHKRLGMVPNLYATIGYSPNALKGFLEFDATLSKGAFHPKEREAIALAVSEINHCNYCLAAHSLMAMKNGIEQDETINIRKGHATDLKMNAVIQLAQAIAETKGTPSPEYLENFYAAGYDEAALMELVGLITVRIFTNYVFALTNIPVDFPAAMELS
jgi:uncharacterized peroxidase-related enzyme